MLCPLVIAIVMQGEVRQASSSSSSSSSSPQDSLQRHYDAAQTFQASGDTASASVEYKRFLAEALHHLADSRSNSGDSGRAALLFEEALVLAPEDADLHLEYAQSAMKAGNLRRAKMLGQRAVALSPKTARAHSVLGGVLSRLGEEDAAAKELEAAVALDSNFSNGYALASEYLKLKDTKRAARLFAEMQRGFGDTAEMRMQFGRAYAQAGFPEEGAQEFKRALAKPGSVRGAHYSLGATYLMSRGEAAFPEAEAEFHQELAHNPHDFLTLYQLGNIHLSKHKWDEAESELRRASLLQPNNPDPVVLLGQLYYERERPAQAEEALRAAIQLTHDPSRNHYQIQRAHYLLSRLLLQSGRTEEGRAEMDASEQLLKRTVALNQGKPGEIAASVSWGEKEQPELSDPGEVKQAESLERRIGPAIADSYNNLGAIAADHNDFQVALGFFQKAADWNPLLEGVDYNLGKAAFQANEFERAVAPLQRYLRRSPEDAWIRAALATSLFTLKNYSGARETLQPIEMQIRTVPRLAYVYAICLVKTGEFSQGGSWLKNLEEKAPNLADLHSLRGEALNGEKDYKSATEELRIAIGLNPTDPFTRYQLALALIGLGQKDEAERLLAALVTESHSFPGAAYQLGKLQLERGEIRGAVATLEAGAKLEPESERIHYELGLAYQQASRGEDAAREMKLYQAMKDKPSAPESLKPD